jgi:O-antigen ligase
LWKSIICAAPAAHNTWLQSLFEVGAIGTGLYALFILFALHLSVKFYRQTGIMPFSLPILVFSLLCGLFGIVFAGGDDVRWLDCPFVADRQARGD